MRADLLVKTETWMDAAIPVHINSFLFYRLPYEHRACGSVKKKWFRLHHYFAYMGLVRENTNVRCLTVVAAEIYSKYGTVVLMINLKIEQPYVDS